MSLVTEQAAFLLDMGKLVVFATELGFVVTGGELARTPEQQAIYVKTGRSKTMNSNHIKRLAVDLNFFKDGVLCYDKAVLTPIGEYWQSLNKANRWGGFFKSLLDVPHFERQV
jgi:D-alanyl-D-alanine carboxypeptidase